MEVPEEGTNKGRRKRGGQGVGEQDHMIQSF